MFIGLDIYYFILGLEGMLGVVIEVSLWICLLFECKVYGFIVFFMFDIGVVCVREIVK